MSGLMSGIPAFLPPVSLSEGSVRVVEAAFAATGHAAGGGLELGEGAAILIVLLAGFLPTEMWRTLAVLAGRNVQEGSAVLAWVRAVATALLAAVVARLVLTPTGALLAVPLTVRLAAIGCGVVAFLILRRSVFAGVLAGEIVLVAGAVLAAP